MTSSASADLSTLVDDDVLTVATETSSFGSEEYDIEPRRSVKRRRVEGRDPSSQLSNDDDNDDDLPSLRGRTSDDTDEDSQDPKSKYKIFIPKHTLVQENTFVTQLTQPPSSPSRIRGPRWKRPDAELLQDRTGNRNSTTQRSVSSGREYVDNDDFDLREAIAASLQSWETEKAALGSNRIDSPPPISVAVQEIPSNVTTPVQAGTSFEFGDIPDDAFDSSPSLSLNPRSNAVPPEPRTSLNSLRTKSLSQRANLRQTTLFDLATKDDSQSATCRKSPPPKNEPPTHHALDKEAIRTWVYPTNLGRIRDYQFNIAQRGLFHNLLVALPTGLGKTFIAATVMLNWFRWTRNAQIVFVAPTKPLVSQQVTACLEIAGIPRSQTTLLTGNVPPGIRTEEWQTKRVFFMTPQTLVNDLKTGIADPKRIVLLVVDEAHRATGGYAYVEVVKFLRRFNSSFRVLALTATPGSTVESVQAVIDGLQISRVEIRTEDSLDIRDYSHSRNVDVQTFEDSEDMLLCMDLLSKAVQPSLDELRTLNAFWLKDPMRLTAYGLTKARQQWMGSDVGRNASFGLKGKVNSLISSLASLAHAIDLLKYHGIIPCYRHLVSFRSDTDDKKGGKTKRQIVESEHFKKLMNKIQPWSVNGEFIGHPKLEYLKEVVLNHFMDKGEGLDAGQERPVSSTRVMIFVHFRDSAEEVTRLLRRHEPMIRPHVFVGQSSAKGSNGMDQKTQLTIVQKFKEGTYNTLVATSIGEEGLDIGEVDLIVCYDSSASPIRMLQRMGRTGRKRAGKIVLLLMQGKEEESYIKAKDNYEKMQQMIASGTRFTYHDSLSPRILPSDVKPLADKRVIEIPPENSQQGLPEPKRKGRVPKRPPKKFHMPDDVETGFTTAAQLDSANGQMSQKRLKINREKLVRVKTPPPVEVPSIEDVVLTPDRQSQLEIRYQNIGGTTPQFIRRPRNDAFPKLQRVHRPTKLVAHGSLTRRMVEMLGRMGSVKPDCDVVHETILDSTVRLAERNPPHALGASNIEENWQYNKESDQRNSLSTVGRETPTTKKKSSTTVRHNASPEHALLSPRDDGTSELSRMIFSPVRVPDIETTPFYQSQVSALDEKDMDLDMPDITTLLNSNANKRKMDRRRRLTIDDDDDDFF